jgi:hypothetical protein
MQEKYTRAQITRYTTRSRTTGKYETLSSCNICGKGVAEGFSHDRTMKLCGDGSAHWLCSKCAKKLEKMTDAEIIEFMKGRK